MLFKIPDEYKTVKEFFERHGIPFEIIKEKKSNFKNFIRKLFKKGE
jgi:hypothetical protein